MRCGGMMGMGAQIVHLTAVFFGFSRGLYIVGERR